MSNQVMNACRPVQMPATPKNVLMAIADRANDDGLAWPSIPGLCEATCYSRRAVINAIKTLERSGFVTVEKTVGRNNRLTIDLEHVKAAMLNHRPVGIGSTVETGAAGAPVQQVHPCITCTPTRAAGAPPPVQQVHLPVQQVHPNHHEPPDNHQATTKTRKRISKPAPPSIPVDTLIAAGFDADTAREFIAHKDRLGTPLTERAWSDHLRESDKAGWDPMAAAEKVMGRGWKGFEAKYVANESRRQQPMSTGESKPTWAISAGFANRYEAENAGCTERNATTFTDGQRAKATP